MHHSPAAPTSLRTTLQQLRRARRVSQLELSFQLGVSQRHVSFVESGRARPSRELLAAWLQALDAPLVVQNEAMLEAGFAPTYGHAPLTDPTLAHANHALAQLLAAHDPLPAFVVDADWNVLRLNRGAQWLAATLVPWALDASPTATINMLDLLAHPRGFTTAMLNLAEVAPTLLAQVRHECAGNPALQPRLQALERQLRDRLGDRGVLVSGARPSAPALITRFATPHGVLALFSMFTTFGTPQDITLASLRVEHMFAADDATAMVLRAQVP